MSYRSLSRLQSMVYPLGRSLSLQLLIGALIAAWAGPSLAATVSVDPMLREAPIGHRANGYLVSIEPESPSEELVGPLRPTSFRESPGYAYAITIGGGSVSMSFS